MTASLRARFLASVTASILAFSLVACGDSPSRHERFLETVEQQNDGNVYSKQEALDRATDIHLWAIDPEESLKPTRAEAKAVIEELDLDWSQHALIVARDIVFHNARLPEERIQERLEDRKFSSSEIEYALTHLDVDWADRAEETAEEYLNSYPNSSPKDVEFNLEFHGFTPEEIQEGLTRLEVDSAERASIVATKFLNADSNLSRAALIETLEEVGFSAENAETGADDLEVDWNERALSAATKKVDLGGSRSTPDFLRDYLEEWQFTEEEVAHVLEVYATYE